MRPDGKEVARVNTMGFNPYFHTAAFIRKEVARVPEIQRFGKEVSKVFFYGAGCSSPSLNAIVAEGLQEAFPNAEILVDHDLKSCAYATYNGEPNISCILGTGSNSVYFDGKEISEEVPALAYILGDEGSGSYLGKKLLAAYLYKQLPPSIQEDFEQTYTLRRDEIMEHVYARPHANVYLAGFAPFFSKHIKHPYMWEIVFTGFRTFLEIHALCYPNARAVELNFVGSIAYHFKDVLEDAAEHLDLKMGIVVQKPLDGLIAYHFNYLLRSPSTIKMA